MAHELYTRNGKTSMAFVGETPWHQLGQRVTEGASLETWTEQAGFDWQALEAPVEFTRADGTVAKMGERKVIYRSDTGAPLSVMGDGYNIVQPHDVLEFFRDLTEQNHWHIHTAGVLRGGRKLWALARNHTQGDVVPGDTVKGNLLLTTSLDGSTPTIAGLTAIRVVCANTLAIALNGRNLGKNTRVSHRSIFDADAVKREIGVAHESFDAFMVKARQLAEHPVAINEARDILRRIFGQPYIPKGQQESIVSAETASMELTRLLGGTPKLVQPKEQRSVSRVMELFMGAGRGSQADGVAGTRWGLLNAVTEHVDHEQGRSADTRLDSAWFGRGNDFKQSTLEALLAA